MNCGHSWTTKATSSESGWLWMQTLVRLWAFTLARAHLPQHANCGNLCPPSIDNARLHTLTFGQPMRLFCRAKDIEQLEKKPALTSYPIAIQQHLEATGISLGAKNVIFLKIVRKSYRCNLVFHPSLQCIITSLALPALGNFTHFLYRGNWQIDSIATCYS